MALTKKCPVCGQKFIPNGPRQIYDTKTCQRKAERARANQRKMLQAVEPKPALTQSTFVEPEEILDDETILRQSIRERHKGSERRAQNGARDIAAPESADRADRKHGGDEQRGAFGGIGIVTPIADGIDHDDEPDAGSHWGFRRGDRAHRDGDGGAVEDQRSVGERDRDGGDEAAVERPSGIQIIPLDSRRKRQNTPPPPPEPDPAPEEEKKRDPFGMFKGQVISIGRAISGTPLNRTEQDKYRDIMKEVMQAVSNMIDNGMTYSNRAHATSEVWALDDEDAYILTDAWLTVAGHNRQTAYATRAIVAVRGNVRVPIILGERALNTYLFYLRNGGFGF